MCSFQSLQHDDHAQQIRPDAHYCRCSIASQAGRRCEVLRVIGRPCSNSCWRGFTMEAGSWRPDTTGPRRLCGWSVGPSAKHWRADSPSVYVEFLQQQQHPGGRVVSVLDSGGALGPGFKSQPRRCRLTVLGKLFTPIVPLFTKQRLW